jgi:hypothetical protein
MKPLGLYPVGVFAAWLGVAGLCMAGNPGLDLLCGLAFHGRRYALAEHLATSKLGLSWVGSSLFVPGQSAELEHARSLLANIREEELQSR